MGVLNAVTGAADSTTTELELSVAGEGNDAARTGLRDKGVGLRASWVWAEKGKWPEEELTEVLDVSEWDTASWLDEEA